MSKLLKIPQNQNILYLPNIYFIFSLCIKKILLFSQ